MDSFKVNLKNCHGIKKLNYSFPFDNNKENKKNADVFLLYASNGIMKTSFANTFKDLCEGIMPQNIFTNDKPVYKVSIIENGKEIELKSSSDFKNNIFVVSSMDESFDFSDTAPLIYDSEIRKKYDEIFNNIINIENDFFKKIKSKSRIKIGKNQDLKYSLETLILSDFDNEYNNIFDLFIYCSDKESCSFLDEELFVYDYLFSENVLKILQDSKFIENIEEYSKNLNILLNNSKIFNENNFTHYHANNLSKSIKTNNLFSAGHKIKFKGIGKFIESHDEFDRIIKLQYDNIFKNEKLKESFLKIDKKFTNEKSRKLRDYIYNNPGFIKYLSDINLLKRIYWISLFFSEKDLFIKLINEYKFNKENLLKIKEKINEESTNWEKIINLFNSWFYFPFNLILSNKENVILKDNVPIIEASIKSEDKYKIVSLSNLKKIVSAGEQRVLYMLNILYKINMLNDNVKLLIFDDIVDSFDYQNKYAIIEYLHNLSLMKKFKMIILTHNYDFFRTVKSRLNCKYCRFAIKNEYDRINISKNKPDLFNDLIISIENNDKKFNKSFIASIPFIRNLSEFKRDNISKNKLTNLLHYKKEGKYCKINDLSKIYDDWNIKLPDNDSNIYDLIFDEAKIIADKKNKEISIIDKIVLSIAIRLYAEKFMLSELNCSSDNFKSYQTRKLYDLYKEKCNDKTVLNLLNKVNIMTSENIHINSFMYEPLIDMDNNFLIDLHDEIRGLKNV